MRDIGPSYFVRVTWRSPCDADTIVTDSSPGPLLHIREVAALLERKKNERDTVEIFEKRETCDILFEVPHNVIRFERV